MTPHEAMQQQAKAWGHEEAKNPGSNSAPAPQTASGDIVLKAGTEIPSKRTSKLCMSYTISEGISGDRGNKILSRISEKNCGSVEVRFRTRSSYVDHWGLRDWREAVGAYNSNNATSSNTLQPHRHGEKSLLYPSMGYERGIPENCLIETYPFPTSRPFEDTPGLQQCKFCKSSVLKTAVAAQVEACVKARNEKLKRKNEQKLKYKAALEGTGAGRKRSQEDEEVGGPKALRVSRTNPRTPIADEAPLQSLGSMPCVSIREVSPSVVSKFSSWDRFTAVLVVYRSGWIMTLMREMLLFKCF